MKVERYVRLFVVVLLFPLSVSALLAQTSSGVLRGQVADPSGAAISGASVIMTPATGSPIVIQSNAQGMYEFFVANGERVLHCPDDLQCIVLGVKLRRSEMVAHVKKVVWDQKIIELVKRELE